MYVLQQHGKYWNMINTTTGAVQSSWSEYVRAYRVMLALNAEVRIQLKREKNEVK